jgi:hypothetical protein
LKNFRHAIVVMVLPALILVIFAVSSVAAQGGAGKSSVCHSAGDKFVEINISNNAVPAHMRHGDVTPDEYGDCP